MTHSSPSPERTPASSLSENCPECLGWRGAHGISCSTQLRICRYCGEWIRPGFRAWTHVGGEARCESLAEPMVTVREAAGLDPYPDANAPEVAS